MQRTARKPAKISKKDALRIALGAAAIAVAWPALAAPPPSQVRFTEVIEHVVRSSIRLPGSVQSRTTSVVASEVAGLVVEMNVREGQPVQKDQPLARLRPITFELLLRAARGQLKEAGARLQLAESKLSRARRLFGEEVISQEELDDAFSENTAWQGRVDQTNADILRLEVALDRCVIRAPFEGVVTSKRTEVGQWLQQGGEVVEMVAPADLEVRVEVPEKAYDRLRSGLGQRLRRAQGRRRA
jgi:multidrug efflux system membrane fusion protein